MFSEDKTRNLLQHCCLDILKDIDRVCKENNIKYLMCAGALIGAVRHKGFIPWDDDIDLWMPRKDYERFIKIANEHLNERYKVVYYTDFTYPEKPHMPFAQVIDLKTKLIRNWANNKKEINAWVDLFPLDGMPKQKWRQELHYYHYKFWYGMMQISWFDDVVNMGKPNRPWYEKAIMGFINATHLGKNWNTIAIIERIQNLLKKYDINTSDYVASMQGIYRKKEIIPRKWVEERMLAPFEDEEIYIPVEYDSVLRHYYGDYMTPPKERAEKEDRHLIKVVKIDD